MFEKLTFLVIFHLSPVSLLHTKNVRILKKIKNKPKNVQRKYDGEDTLVKKGNVEKWLMFIGEENVIINCYSEEI